MTVKNKTNVGPDLSPHQIILRPLVTEKSTHQSEHRQAYPFEVNMWSTKEDIKKAVQELFNVRVIKVRTQMRIGKTKRFRNRLGKLSDWKKAIVTLHDDDHIDFF